MLAYLCWGNSTQKANILYSKHLSEEIKSQLISMSDDYKKMKNWLIENYGSPSWIVGDIVGDLLKKGKPSNDNRKQKFVFFLAITGAIQRLERLSRVCFIDGEELEACLLSRSTLSGLISLLPSSEHDFWVREMSMVQLDFRNPEGLDTFNCFKRVCIIKRNTNESFRNDPEIKSIQIPAVKKLPRSTHKVQIEKQDSSDSESESSVYIIYKSSSKQWRPSSSMKFPCPINGHEHEVSQCLDFFKLSPDDRWNSLEKGRTVLYLSETSSDF